ncbi:MAG TPA: DUF4349 domain-containing protein [Allosphingosinicella sp.]|nr:DUF4349 domain-containing protein [Allosphingosinicella sp.]
MRRLPLIACLLFTAACGRHDRGAQGLRMFEVEQPAAPIQLREPPPPDKPEDPDAQDADAALPQIAYTYTIGYRAAAGAIAGLQRRQIGLCDRLGPARCRIVSMSGDAGEDAAPRGALSLLVEARIARAFQDRLDSLAAGSGGSVSSRGIEAEDLSRQLVDTAAKVRGKEALADRLVQLLRSRGGRVGELVEAEKAYAQTEEELDAARAWLAEMRGRVAMSKIDIAYDGIVPVTHSAWMPVREAFADAGEVVSASVAKLIRLLLSILPWLLFLALAVFALRRLGWRPRLPRPRRRAAAA